MEHNEVRLPHIAIEREPDRAPVRRQGTSWGSRSPRPTSRAQHGADLAVQLSRAVETGVTARSAVGISSDKLKVLVLASVSPNALAQIEQRFRAHVVDERKVIRDGVASTRLTVQFQDDAALEDFEAELAAYQQGSDEPGFLPPAGRLEFFDGLASIEDRSSADREGPRLRQAGWPDSSVFFVDLDLWHPGDDDAARDVMDELRRICADFGGAITDEVRTNTLLLAKVSANTELANALLNLDLTAQLDLPPRMSVASLETTVTQDPPDPLPPPPVNAPRVCVIDSGVVSGHPLLQGWVIDERDFNTGEGTAVDREGHGTAVGGLVIHGDIASALENSVWNPRVTICSAKILRKRVDGWPGVDFPEHHRIERVIEEAIRHFHGTMDCRVFNISVASEDDLYAGGRQFPLAEKLDELARELDIVIVVVVGNRSDPPIPVGARTRDELHEFVQQNLFTDEHRLCNPGTSALSLTVGSIARSEATAHHAVGVPSVSVRNAVAAVPADAPSPFSRTGFGYAIDGNRTIIKPDVVNYGGNWALQTIAGGPPRWVSDHVLLGEPSPRLDWINDGRIVGARSGTSFAAPHVAHGSALAFDALTGVLGIEPSANLVRALIGNVAQVPSSTMPLLADEEKQLRACGYGLPSIPDLEWSSGHCARLVAMDELAEDTLHFYRLPVPPSFLEHRGHRGLVISLAFDPPVRASRKEY